jgi:hypothetical protein
MTHEEFERIFEYVVAKVSALLLWKNKKYASLEDKFHNFLKAAEFRDMMPAKVLMGIVKHIVNAVDDMVQSEEPAKEIWQEKVFAEIAYLIILYGMVEEGTAFGRGEVK